MSCPDCDTWRGRAEALAEASNMRQAHAEALAAALLDIRTFTNDCSAPTTWTRIGVMDRCDAARARLPADALAERRALETDAARYRFLRNEAVPRSEYGVFDGQGYWTGVQLDERLDATRQGLS